MMVRGGEGRSRRCARSRFCGGGWRKEREKRGRFFGNEDAGGRVKSLIVVDIVLVLVLGHLVVKW
jgi:hypothetical protein